MVKRSILFLIMSLSSSLNGVTVHNKTNHVIKMSPFINGEYAKEIFPGHACSLPSSLTAIITIQNSCYGVGSYIENSRVVVSQDKKGHVQVTYMQKPQEDLTNSIESLITSSENPRYEGNDLPPCSLAVMTVEGSFYFVGSLTEPSRAVVKNRDGSIQVTYIPIAEEQDEKCPDAMDSLVNSSN